MVVSYSGIAGRRGYNPTKIVIHNDGGSQGANAAFYKNWLEYHDPTLGYAHYYVGDDGTYQAELDGNCAWHCANSTGNRDYIGLEVCQSMGDEATFLANEQKTFKLAADLCKKYKLNPTVAIFPLHKELSSTDCPHRSCALHGQATVAVRQYYVSQVQKYMNDQTTTPHQPKPTTKKGARAMFVYILKPKKGANQYWGVNGDTRFHFSNMNQVNHYKKIVKANGGDTTINMWSEGSIEMQTVEMMAPNVSKK